MYFSSAQNDRSICCTYILFISSLTSFELFDQLKQRWLSAQSMFSLHRHAMPCHRWRCLFWLSSSESKSPRGTKPETYPLCMGNKEESTVWMQWRERASWTLTGLLSSREITQIQAKKLHWNIEESSVLCSSISICSTWRNDNFHYLIDPIISQRERYYRIFPATPRCVCRWYISSLILSHYCLFMKQLVNPSLTLIVLQFKRVYLCRLQ